MTLVTKVREEPTAVLKMARKQIRSTQTKKEKRRMGTRKYTVPLAAGRGGGEEGRGRDKTRTRPAITL